MDASRSFPSWSACLADAGPFYVRSVQNTDCPVLSAAEQYQLGLPSEFGLRQQCIDQVAALAWYRKAADQGYAKAQERMGVFYHAGLGGVKKDLATARTWYEKAAAQNEPSALYRLAWMRCYGQAGIEKDEVKARADVLELLPRLREEARKGDVPTQLILGRIFWVDSGWNMGNDEERVQWYRQAAELGCAGAQLNLGAFYLEGSHGLPRDPAVGVEWIKKAAASGFEAAVNVLTKLGVQHSV